jgi:hypothetical protein
MQTISVKDQAEMDMAISGLCEAERQLAPDRWLVYGNDSADAVLSKCGIQSSRLIRLRTRSEARDAKRKAYVAAKKEMFGG